MFCSFKVLSLGGRLIFLSNLCCNFRSLWCEKRALETHSSPPSVVPGPPQRNSLSSCSAPETELRYPPRPTFPKTHPAIQSPGSPRTSRGAHGASHMVSSFSFQMFLLPIKRSFLSRSYVSVVSSSTSSPIHSAT